MPDAYRMWDPPCDPHRQPVISQSATLIACDRHVPNTSLLNIMSTRTRQSEQLSPRRTVTTDTVTFSTSRGRTAVPPVLPSARNRRFRRPAGRATASPISNSSSLLPNWLSTDATTATTRVPAASRAARRTIGGHAASGAASNALHRLSGGTWRRHIQQLLQRASLVRTRPSGRWSRRHAEQPRQLLPAQFPSSQPDPPPLPIAAAAAAASGGVIAVNAWRSSSWQRSSSRRAASEDNSTAAAEQQPPRSSSSTAAAEQQRAAALWQTMARRERPSRAESMHAFCHPAGAAVTARVSRRSGLGSAASPPPCGFKERPHAASLLPRRGPLLRLARVRPWRRQLLWSVAMVGCYDTAVGSSLESPCPRCASQRGPTIDSHARVGACRWASQRGLAERSHRGVPQEVPQRGPTEGSHRGVPRASHR